MCGNDGYPNFENILHNDDDSSFNFILCVSSECEDILPTKCTEKCDLLGRKNVFFIFCILILEQVNAAQE